MPRSASVLYVGQANDVYPSASGIGPNGTSTSVLPEAVCSQWRDWRRWTDEQKDQVRNLILDEFDALQNFFFWTWK